MAAAGENNKVRKLLDMKGYDPALIEDPAPLTVEISRYQKYGELLKNSFFGKYGTFLLYHSFQIFQNILHNHLIRFKNGFLYMLMVGKSPYLPVVRRIVPPDDKFQPF